MININFFEKKELNILPYLISGLFFIGLLIMTFYFFFSYTFLNEQIDDNNQWIEDNAEEVALSRKISQVDQRINESIVLQEDLKERQYPMYKISEEISKAIPDELTRVLSYQHTQENQITLSLQNTDALLGKQIVEEIEELNYVEEVQFIFAESQTEEDKQHRFELIIDLDEDLIFEEEIE